MSTFATKRIWAGALAATFGAAAIGAAALGCKKDVVQLSSGGEDSSSSVSDKAPMADNGPTKTEARKVNTFGRIKVSSAIQADIKIGSPQSVTVEAGQAVLSAIATRVEGDTLVVETTRPISNTGPMRVTITVASLDGIETSGATTVTASGIKATSFKLDSSGASRVTVSGDLGRLTAKVSSASTVVLAGMATDGEFEADGASTIDASKLKEQGVKGTCEGASTLRLGVTEKVDLEASGASTITYPGKPQVIRSDASGASSISGGS